ncbi:MAG TPA: hypothetical protein VES69_06545, partial [Pyrinomonadaceae bacterium]|nr:hypothetical protein [Pyrinomonadaceae bacterium]
MLESRPTRSNNPFWGCARQAGGGPNVARQITHRAGVPETSPAFTVNQACGSGLKAITLGSGVMLGRAGILLTVGTEVRSDAKSTLLVRVGRLSISKSLPVVSLLI